MILQLFYYLWECRTSDRGATLLRVRESKQEWSALSIRETFDRMVSQSRTQQEFCHKWSKIKFLHWQYSHYSSSVITRTGEILPEVIQFWGTPKSDPETLTVWRLLGMLFSFLKLSMANRPATFLVLILAEKCKTTAAGALLCYLNSIDCMC